MSRSQEECAINVNIFALNMTLENVHHTICPQKVTSASPSVAVSSGRVACTSERKV